MKIEDKKLIIDQPIENERLEEFMNLLKQNDTESIIIQNPQLDSSIIQAIMCFAKDKAIECSDTFLSKVFDNTIYIEE